MSDSDKIDHIESEEVDTEQIQPDDEADREHYLKSLFEAVFFLSNEPVPVSFFVKNFMIDPTHAKNIIDSLVDEYEERDGGIRLAELSNGYQFVTNAKLAEQLRHALGLKKRESLSKGMLETLAIIAYKQPITLADIDELRGASSRMMVANLMKRNLVKPVGRKELPGRPLAYGTTDEFLRYFGLSKLSDLPKLSEIKEFSLDTE
jgi:segregation and condensation protein B